jgi:hypothetical protein
MFYVTKMARNKTEAYCGSLFLKIIAQGLRL